MATSAKAGILGRLDTADGRFYQTTEGGLLPSVNTILRVLARPGLDGWIAWQERKHVAEAAAALRDEVGAGVSKASFTSAVLNRLGAKKAYELILHEAAALGTSVHQLIEWEERRHLGESVGSQPLVSDRGWHAYAAYVEWRAQYELQPIAVEQVVCSREYGYAGTFDLLGQVSLKGERVVALMDWKVTSKIHPEAHLQLAAYIQAAIEIGLVVPPVIGMVVRLPRAGGEKAQVQVTPWEQHSALLEVFLAAKALWHWRNPKAS
jgi:hypothetical protein